MVATIYTDGACAGNPGRGGWAAIVLEGGQKRVLHGSDPHTTNNRMEITAAIKGLEAVPEGQEVSLFSDSEYVVNTMTRGWRRRANLDLWQRLDALAARRQVRWQWVQGHAGNSLNEEADAWANYEAGLRATPPGDGDTTLKPSQPLTHLDQQGRARMVDVGWKEDTEREAVARGFVAMKPETLALITAGRVEKGDVLATARIAGIMAAKRTPDLIPLCHPLPLTHVSLELEPDKERSGIHIAARVKTVGKTGVEMEALTAVSVAALTVYDMCKAVDRGMRIEAVRLVRKTGGKSGEIILEEE